MSKAAKRDMGMTKTQENKTKSPSKRLIDLFGKKKKSQRGYGTPSSDHSDSTYGRSRTPDLSRSNGLQLVKSDVDSISYGSNGQSRMNPYSEVTVDLYGNPYNDPWGNHLVFNRSDTKRHVVKRTRSLKSLGSSRSKKDDSNFDYGYPSYAEGREITKDQLHNLNDDVAQVTVRSHHNGLENTGGLNETMSLKSTPAMSATDKRTAGGHSLLQGIQTTGQRPNSNGLADEGRFERTGVSPDSGYSATEFSASTTSNVVNNASYQRNHTVMGNHNSRRGSYDVRSNASLPTTGKPAVATFEESNGRATLVLDPSMTANDVHNNNTATLVSTVEAYDINFQRKQNPTVNYSTFQPIQSTSQRHTNGPSQISSLGQAQRKRSLKSYRAPPIPTTIPPRGKSKYTTRNRDGSTVHSVENGGLVVRTLNATGDVEINNFDSGSSTLSSGWTSPSLVSPTHVTNYDQLQYTDSVRKTTGFVNQGHQLSRQGSIHGRINRVAGSEVPIAAITRGLSARAENVDLVKGFDEVDTLQRVENGRHLSTIKHHSTTALFQPDRFISTQASSPVSHLVSSPTSYSTESGVSSLMAEPHPGKRTLTVQAKLPFNDVGIQNEINTSNSALSVETSSVRSAGSIEQRQTVRRLNQTVPADNEYSYVLKSPDADYDTRMTTVRNTSERPTNFVSTRKEVHVSSSVGPYSTPHTFQGGHRVMTGPHKTSIYLTSDADSGTGSVDFPKHRVRPHCHDVTRELKEKVIHGPHKTYLYITSDSNSEREPKRPERGNTSITIESRKSPSARDTKTTVHVSSLPDAKKVKSGKRNRKPQTNVYIYDDEKQTRNLTPARVYSTSGDSSETEESLHTEESCEKVYHINVESEHKRRSPLKHENRIVLHNKTEKKRQQLSPARKTSSELSEVSNTTSNRRQPITHRSTEKHVRVVKHTTLADDTLRDVTGSPERQRSSRQKFTNESSVIVQSPPKAVKKARSRKMENNEISTVESVSNKMIVRDEEDEDRNTSEEESGSDADENQNTKVPAPEDLQVERKDVLISNYIDTTGPRIVDIDEDENVNMFEKSYFTSHENPLYFSDHSDDEHSEKETVRPRDEVDNRLTGKNSIRFYRPSLFMRNINHSSNYSQNWAQSFYEEHLPVRLTHSRGCQTPESMFLNSLVPEHMRSPWKDGSESPYSVRKTGHVVFKSAHRPGYSGEPNDPNKRHVYCQTEDINMFHGAFLSDTFSSHLFGRKLTRTDSMSSVTSVNDLYREAKSESYRYETGFKPAPPKSFELSDIERRKQEFLREKYVSERRKLIENSVKTSVHVDHDEQNIDSRNIPEEETELIDQDNVHEHVELGIVGSTAQVRVRVVAERLVPSTRGSKHLKKSIVTVTKVTEIDMNALPETRALFHKIQNSPGIARRMVNNATSVSNNEQTLDGRDVYRIYNALSRIQEEAEQLKKVRPSKVVVSGTMNGEMFSNANLELPKWTEVSGSVVGSDDDDHGSTTSNAGSLLY